jgi:hypothetical protein
VGACLLLVVCGTRTGEGRDTGRGRGILGGGGGVLWSETIARECVHTSTNQNPNLDCDKDVILVNLFDCASLLEMRCNAKDIPITNKAQYHTQIVSGVDTTSLFLCFIQHWHIRWSRNKNCGKFYKEDSIKISWNSSHVVAGSSAWMIIDHLLVILLKALASRR